MPKFKVYLQQYVEEVAEMIVEASTPQEATQLALERACEAEWSEGSDSYAARVWHVDQL